MSTCVKYLLVMSRFLVGNEMEDAKGSVHQT